jgi:hypothetical protein
MPGSDDVLKNLLGAMQGMIIASTLLSIALLSNLALSLTSDEEIARVELEQLLKDQREVGNNTPGKLLGTRLETILTKIAANVSRDQKVTATFVIDKSQNVTRQIIFQYDEAQTESDNDDATAKKFADIKTLDEMEKAWNRVALRNRYWLLLKPDHISLQKKDTLSDRTRIDRSLENVRIDYWLADPKTQYGMVAAIHYPIDGLQISTAGDEVSLDYEFPRQEAFGNDKPQAIVQAFKLTPDEWNKIEGFTLSLTWTRSLPQRLPPLPPFTDKLGHPRTFADAFPHLAALSNDDRKQSLSALLGILKSHERSGVEIELLGMKLPSDLIFFFGLPILAVLLFLFGATARHTKRIVVQLEKEYASQWPLLLKGPPFSVLTYGAILVLPLAASCGLPIAAHVGKLSFSEEVPILTLKEFFGLLVVVCALFAAGGLHSLHSSVVKAPNIGKKSWQRILQRLGSRWVRPTSQRKRKGF